jgi:hypothetical protein
MNNMKKSYYDDYEPQSKKAKKIARDELRRKKLAIIMNDSKIRIENGESIFSKSWQT